MSGSSDVYTPDDDIRVGGGSLHDTTQQPGGGYTPADDTRVGVSGSQSGTDQPGTSILATPWKYISAAGNEAWNIGKGAVQTVRGDPGAREAAGVGAVRGFRNFWDKVIENPAPEAGYYPSAEDMAAVKQQNIADRAAFDQKYGGNPAAAFGELGGDIVGTAPVVAPLSMALGPATEAIPYVADAIAARGLLGVAGRTTQRAVTGAAAGGTQAAMASDPTQPLAPQVASGAIWGALIPALAGLPTDAISNAIRRLTGKTVPVNPTTGKPYDVADERAKNAQVLLNNGVRVQASQVSDDPALQAVDKIGSQIPGSGSGDFLPGQWQEFRTAALRKVDPTETGSLVDKDFNNRTEATIKNGYGLTVNSVPSVDGTGLNGAYNLIRSNLPNSLTPEERGIVNGAMKDVQDAFGRGGGQLSGADAHALIMRSGATLQPLLDSGTKAVRDAGKAISDEVSGRLRAQMTPEQNALFDQTNQQYRTWKTLQSVSDSDGSFHPGALYKATQDTTDRYGGSGALDDLARAGDSVIQRTMDGRGGPGPRVTGKASPYIAGAVASAATKALSDWITTGGVGSGTAATVMGANRGLQALNRASGPRAINATLAGGGASVGNWGPVLDAIRMLGVANQQQANQPPNQ